MIQGPPIGANRQLRSAKRRVAVDRLYLSCPASRPGRKHMGIYKRIVLTGLAGVAIGLSTVALAQMSGSKSQGLGKLGEDEAMRVGPAGTIQKSNMKVPSARHEAAIAKGAKEISPNIRDLQARRQDVHVRLRRRRQYADGREFPGAVRQRITRIRFRLRRAAGSPGGAFVQRCSVVAADGRRLRPCRLRGCGRRQTASRQTVTPQMDSIQMARRPID